MIPEQRTLATAKRSASTSDCRSHTGLVVRIEVTNAYEHRHVVTGPIAVTSHVHLHRESGGNHGLALQTNCREQ